MSTIIAWLLQEATTTRPTEESMLSSLLSAPMTQILVTVGLGAVVLLLLIYQVEGLGISSIWKKFRSLQKADTTTTTDQQQTTTSGATQTTTRIALLALGAKQEAWWDDLAPPFSLESMTTIAEDVDLQEYNKKPVDIMHFCFLLHGIRGYSRDLSYLQTVMEIFVDKEKRKLCEASKTSAATVPHQDMLVHTTVCNEGKTTDGVINGGNRVVEEMYTVMRAWIQNQQHLPKEMTISFVGNSLGGVYARYAIMRLAQDGMNVPSLTINNENNNTTKTDTLPFQFNIFCTTAAPHLGVSRHTYMPLPRTAELGVARTMGETGSDLFLVTDLMKRMALEESFVGPLRQFRKRMALANAYGTDFPVPVGTAAFLSDQSDYPHFFETTTTVASSYETTTTNTTASSSSSDEEETDDDDDASNSNNSAASSTASSSSPPPTRNYVIATLHTPPKPTNTPPMMSAEQQESSPSDNNNSDDTTTTPVVVVKDAAAALDDDLAEMSRSLDSLGWKKVFVDMRNEIPMSIKLPSFVRRSNLSSSLSMAASSFGATTTTTTDCATNTTSSSSPLDDPSAASSSSSSSSSCTSTTAPPPSQEESVMAILKQKGVVESREFKQAISASVPISRDGKLSIPLGHNMIVAFSRSRLATLMNKGGRPIVDGLAKELVEDVFSWNNSSSSSSDGTIPYASSLDKKQ
uniref:DUF676 domain-containing protein n=1 Tax=Grammatophora oceanica TaxID=210454 RepID=A0A7S1VJ90_9STRA